MRALSVLVILGACGNNHAGPSDAPIDVYVADAPVDVPPPAPGHYHYVLDHMNVPTNNNEARTYGLDLNNDGTVDNQLGLVFGTLAGMGATVQASTTTAVDNGSLLTLIDLYTTDFTTAAAPTLTTYDGANPFPHPCNGAADTTCRHHLGGNGMFTEASPMDTPLTGTLAGGTLTVGPGNLHIELLMFGPPAIQLTLIGARAKLVGTTATNITGGILAGGISNAEMAAKVYPGMQASILPIVQRDCCGLATSPGGATCTPPACGCLDGSTGKTMIGLFDVNHDCTVSATEVQNNSLFMSLFAPDLSINGQMALSVGVGFTAVPGAFAP